ncbi:DsbE family thiol:disulfide interchange protein [Poseidonocella sp. HB161398]|uniref:DsbE family thiol:disulfide interchange protein n=1 Tax=Poseidonocella sp. HB161398 TaxID=2320855 RepID=UPI0011089C29|nr:DsbE family thiol:disulfide interchange protein [Poseidonocella sp. HB161398]
MARISPLVALPPVIFAGLALAFYMGMKREDPDALPSTLEGRAAPQVVLEPLGGLPEFDLASLADGQVKLVNFWASWCAPCRVEHPNLERLSAEGVTVYGINYKDQPQKALAFLQELGNPYAAVSADESGRAGIDWGIYGVPETFVIDGSGTVILRFPGPITEKVIEDTIRPALAKAEG